MRVLGSATSASKIVIGTVLAVWGLALSAQGQTTPNVQITDPANNDKVTVGPGSAQLGVTFKCANGYYPTSAQLDYTSNGMVTNYDNTTNFSYNGTTGEYTALLSVPAGTTQNVTIIVKAYLPPNSGNPTGKFDNDKVTGITTTKQP